MAEEMHAPTPLAAGAPAPSFTLPGRSGNAVSLADFAGKGHVLVYFYPKDDTPGCTKEACSLRDGFGGLREAGVTVLGISPDDADSHNAFAGKYSLPFELLTDADHAVHEAYGVWGKTAWGVGTIRKSFLVGPDGNLVHVFEKVDVEHHADEVLAALKPAPVTEAKAAVGAAVEAAGAAVTTAVKETRKAVAGAMKSPEMKEAVAAARQAVEDVKQQPAVKKAFADARKAVADAKQAVSDVQKKPAVKRAVAKAKKAVADAKKRPAVKKAVASVKRAVASARTAAAKNPKGAVAKLLALVTPKKRAAPKKKATPARAKKAVPKKATPARAKKAVVKKAVVRKAVVKKSVPKPKAVPKKPAAKKAVSRKTAPKRPARKKAARR